MNYFRPLSMALTERQLEILRYIDRYQCAHGYSPTMREIAEEHGICSTNGVNDHLIALERKGCVIREEMRSRTIRLTDRGLELVASPRLESVQERELSALEHLRSDPYVQTFCADALEHSSFAATPSAEASFYRRLALLLSGAAKERAA